MTAMSGLLSGCSFRHDTECSCEAIDESQNTLTVFVFQIVTQLMAYMSD